MKINFEEFDKRYNKEVEETREKQKKKDPSKKYFTLAYLLLAVVAYFVVANVINGYVEMNKIRYNNSQLEQEIDDLNEEIKNLEEKVKESNNLDYVQKIATEKLGMVHSGKAQVVFIDYEQRFALKDDMKSVTLNDKKEHKFARE